VREPEAPADRQPDMRRCAAATQDAKTGRVKASWANLSPGSSAGRERIDLHPSRRVAQIELKKWLDRKRRRGYKLRA
jgi:hypothetical protein